MYSARDNTQGPLLIKALEKRAVTSFFFLLWRARDPFQKFTKARRGQLGRARADFADSFQLRENFTTLERERGGFSPLSVVFTRIFLANTLIIRTKRITSDCVILLERRENEVVGGVATFVLRPVRAHIPSEGQNIKSTNLSLARVVCVCVLCVGPNAGGWRRKKKINDQ